MSEISARLREVQSRIDVALVRAGRPAGEARLLAVSKTQSVESVQEALDAGQTSFGENYVQEAVDKARLLPQADWQIIGTLQTNKVKQICGPNSPMFSLIHSVDRLKLAQEIDHCAGQASRVQDILLQIHIGDEATKHGVTLEEGGNVIGQILELKNLRLRGIMSLPPLTENEHEARTTFAHLREAAARWKSSLPSAAAAQFTELSLGTSSDYEWAILEGATLVRVGTAIFGHRAARGRP